MPFNPYPDILHWSGGRTSSPPTLSLLYGAPPGGKREQTPSAVIRNEPVLWGTFSRGEGGVR
jgi:hypothetical protein